MIRNPTLNLNVRDNTDIDVAQLGFYSEFVYGRAFASKVEEREAVEHIVRIWRQVKERLHTYRCVQSLAFLIPKLHKFQAYSKLMAIYAEHKAVKVADVGCCFGQDVRKLVLDGIPPAMIWAIDVTGGYWTAGRELYREVGDNVSAHAAAHGIDKVHTNFCDLCAVSISDDVKTDIVNGSFDCVISKNVFHVLSFAQSERLVLRMGQMLKSGGFVMGICLGAQKEKDWAMTPDGSEVRFLQSKKTLTAVFEKYGFQDVLISEMQLVSVRDELEQSMVPDLDDSDKVRLQFTATKS
jgi:hypothetical protein